LRAVLVALGVVLASPAYAATIHGLVFDDVNGDGAPSAGEPGLVNAVVALGPSIFTVTNAAGQFDLTVPVAKGIVWVRVPDGFRPGPVWAAWAAATSGDIDLPLHRLPAGSSGAPTFVVAADTHIAYTQEYLTAADLAVAASAATALDPAPAFFTILGDITQGNRDAEFDLVDAAVGDLGVPFVPVPGNHDWYDAGDAWFRHYGPDNYSFDVGNVHFVVWNMAMSDVEIRTYLGAELSRVEPSMVIIALTHAPPSELVVDALRDLGVDYVLTGHAHSNRIVDHGGVIELNTEPMLMGGLDFTPAGYRVITIDGDRLGSYHRTTVVEPQLSIVSPAPGACVPPRGAALIVAAELDASASNVTAKVDCGTPLALRYDGGWSWQVSLPVLDGGTHALAVEATSATGTRATATASFVVCKPDLAPPAGADWPQLGGSAAHVGAVAHELSPPLVTQWSATVGGHVITAPPVIAGGVVFVAVSDLGDGAAGGVVAIDLATGQTRWRVPTPRTVRGGLAVTDGTVIAPQIDGVVLGFDATTGAERWRHELSAGLAPQAGAVFAAPAADHGDFLVGNQRSLAVLSATGGTPIWTADPVPEGQDSQSAAAIAIADGIAVGTFNRALGGVIAWDRASGARLWSVLDGSTVAINASPIIADDSVYIVSGADEVSALDLQGQVRWREKLDPDGFDWGNATIGTPALADGVLVVPTLYRDLVALDAATGTELWRVGGTPSPLRATHYRGGDEAGFAASPVITGGIVWAADTAGLVSAIDLQTGRVLWQKHLGVPVTAGLATSGDWLVVASYDGSIRALVPTVHPLKTSFASPTCTDPPAAGCCDAGRTPATTLVLVSLVGAMLVRRRRPR
jgi:outer membrane protein assembly factor BamB/predicted phosphodiesterase